MKAGLPAEMPKEEKTAEQILKTVSPILKGKPLYFIDNVLEILHILMRRRCRFT